MLPTMQPDSNQDFYIIINYLRTYLWGYVDGVDVAVLLLVSSYWQAYLVLFWPKLMALLMCVNDRCRSSARWFCRQWWPAWMTRTMSMTSSHWKQWAAFRRFLRESLRRTYKPFLSTSLFAFGHVLRRSLIGFNPNDEIYIVLQAYVTGADFVIKSLLFRCFRF